MNSVFRPKISEILPESLSRDEKIFAAAKALDAELDKLSDDVKQALHLPRLDELSGRILDFLAEQFHLDSYEPLFLSDDVKRNLIRNSIQVHRTKGTPFAVETANHAFGREVEFEEWFKYGGRPYTFRVIVSSSFAAQDDWSSWLRQLQDAKNVRSWATVAIKKKMDATLYFGTTQAERGNINIANAEPQRVYNFVGFTSELRGRVSIPKESIEYDSDINVGFTAAERGKISLPSFQIPQAQAFVGFTQNLHGVITLPSGEKVIVVPEGQYLRLYFDFGEGWERYVTLTNIREGITYRDLAELGQFAADNSLLADSSGRISTGLSRYAVLQVDEPGNTVMVPKIRR